LENNLNYGEFPKPNIEMLSWKHVTLQMASICVLPTNGQVDMIMYLIKETVGSLLSLCQPKSLSLSAAAEAVATVAAVLFHYTL